MSAQGPNKDGSMRNLRYMIVQGQNKDGSKQNRPYMVVISTLARQCAIHLLCSLLHSEIFVSLLLCSSRELRTSHNAPAPSYSPNPFSLQATPNPFSLCPCDAHSPASPRLRLRLRMLLRPTTLSLLHFANNLWASVTSAHHRRYCPTITPARTPVRVTALTQ